MSFTTIPEMFLYVCKKYKDTKDAILSKKDDVYIGISHSALREKVECLSLGLLSLGIRSGDRVGLVAENRLEWIIADLAIASIGAIDAPIFTTLTAKQEEYIFSDCQASAIVVSNNFQLKKVLEFKENISSLRHIIVMNKDFNEQDLAVKSMDSLIDFGSQVRSQKGRKSIIEEHIQKIKPDDLLTIIYTSGTTGNPKGVMLSHRNIITNVQDSVSVIKISDKDRFLSYLPFCHSFERTTGYYAAFSCGCTIALAEGVESIARNIVETKPTFITTVPRLLEMMKRKIQSNIEKESPKKLKVFNWAVETGRKYVYSKLNAKIPLYLKIQYKLADKLVFSKLRRKIGVDFVRFVSGGAPLSPEIAEFFFALGYPVSEGYGLTEASPVVSSNRVGEEEIGTVGRPLPNLELKIAEDGEILVRGSNIMKGYWGDPQASREAIDEEGWLYTGDLGMITEKGNLKITDRKKHILVSSSGKNIAPQPIENLLTQSPYIEQCILIGDSREYCTALITPDFEQLKKVADNFNISYNSPNELITNEKMIKLIKTDLDHLQKDLAKYEKVRKFSLLSAPFTIENGELTPKLSVKRHIVERKYSYLIDEMYKM